MRKTAFLLVFLASVAACAQVPLSAVSATIPQLQQTVENARVDLARLRVDKWKADSSAKQQVAGNVESLQRNMTDALPALISAAQQNPSSLNASFKLYRNLNALYDVMTTVAESAGAFGSKDEYNALARDLGALDNSRRALGDAMDSMTAQRDADYMRAQQSARQAATQANSGPPKKIVIDDNAPAKSSSRKSTKKKTTASAPPQQ